MVNNKIQGLKKNVCLIKMYLKIHLLDEVLIKKPNLSITNLFNPLIGHRILEEINKYMFNVNVIDM